MLANPTVRDVRLAATMCGWLSNLDDANIQQSLDNFVTLDLLAPVTSIYHKSDLADPSYYVAQCRGRTIILVGKTGGLAQAANLNFGYYGRSAPPTSNIVNPWLKDVTGRIWAAMVTRGMSPPDWIQCYGYSLGGAVCYYLADFFRQQVFGSSTFVCTFGSPKVGGESFNSQFHPDYSVRYFFDEDPVPIYPFISGAAYAVPIVTVPVSLFVNNFAQPVGGVKLDQDGNLTPQTLPQNFAPFFSVDFASWLFNLDFNATAPHSIGKYFTALEAAAAKVPAPVNQNIDTFVALGSGGDWGGPAESPTPVAPVVARRQEAAAVQTVFNSGETQQVSDVVIPPAQAFTVLRSGRLWSVFFGETCVALSPTKRRARHFKNLGNALLEAMLKQGAFDPVAFQNQLAIWLQAGQDPASGVVPLMAQPLQVGLAQ